MPTSGPSTASLDAVAADQATDVIQVVDVTDGVTRRLASQRSQRLFSETLGEARAPEPVVGYGDALEVNIWEAPPATLFGSGIDARAAVSGARPTALPEQVVDALGFISVPFAGRIQAAGRTTLQIAGDIAARLKGKANQPEVIVRVLRNVSATVTVVGEVSASVRMPLSPGGERLLDALAAAGGIRQPVAKTTVQITRGRTFQSLPLDTVIRDPRQNVPLHPGDVVTAIFQPLSFTALGATGKNDEISFEAQGITLAQALARVGGLNDNRSDARGVFIFRFENEKALDWPHQPIRTTTDGRVPVVYRLDLRNAASFFVMQNFGINDKDIVYVSNAPLAELQKFLNLVFSVTFPVINAVNVYSNNN